MDDNTIGLLVINKPPRITSHDVVSHIRSLLKTATGQKIKVGHTGTLDPFATGVLLLPLGSATRLSEYSLHLPKEYQTTFILGASSDTDDLTGEITLYEESNKPSQQEVEQVLKIFTGDIKQLPPTYAAIKVKGKKLYEYARAGEEVTVKPREVEIKKITLQKYNYPEITLTIQCGSGTYIRALARDIGEKLNSAAYVKKLSRTAIGKFKLEDATKLEKISEKNLLSLIKLPELLVEHLPPVYVATNNVAKLRQGSAISISSPLPQNQPIAIYQEDTESLIGIGKFDTTASLLSPDKILSTSP